MPSATQVMDELIAELGTASGPCERVIDEYSGNMVCSLIPNAERKAFHVRMDAVVRELRATWGPTANPRWLDDLLPTREEMNSETEDSSLHALFHRPGIWGYVRIHKTDIDQDENAHLRLILGVLRDRT